MWGGGVRKSWSGRWIRGGSTYKECVIEGVFFILVERWYLQSMCKAWVKYRICYYLFNAVLAWIFMYSIQHWYICRPLDSTVSDDAGIEPGSVRRCNHWTHKLYSISSINYLFMTLVYRSACAWLLWFLPYLRKWRTQARKWTPRWILAQIFKILKPLYTEKEVKNSFIPLLFCLKLFVKLLS